MKQHYKGVLGEFDYDDSQYTIKWNDTRKKYYLTYIGNITNGKNIIIPNGLVDAYRLFEYSKIKSAPKIPESIIKAEHMFAYSNIQNVGELPPNLKDARGMFYDCKNLCAGPAKIPSSVTDAFSMFYRCTKLVTPPKLDRNTNVEDCETMFYDCSNLSEIYSLELLWRLKNENLCNIDNMYMGCYNIRYNYAASKLAKYYDDNCIMTIDKLSYALGLSVNYDINGAKKREIDSLNSIKQLYSLGGIKRTVNDCFRIYFLEREH